MEKSLSIAGLSKNSITFLLDFILILFIYFTPALSHLFAFPIYYLDPMKIALVFAIIFTSKRNTFLIAITLPLFSYFISAHPQFIKAILISAELLVNLSLFYYLIKKNNNAFTAFIFSILAGKIIYYLSKFFLINQGMIKDALFSTPYYYQIITAIVLGILLFLNFRDVKKKTN